MNEIDLAWVAGFFDGEGCVGINKRVGGRHYVLEVTVSQRLAEPLYRVQQILGFGAVYRTKAIRDYGVDMWTYRATANAGSRMLALLLPYLFVKREQAELALAFQGRRLARGKHLSMSQEAITAHRQNDDREYLAMKSLKRSFKSTPTAAVTGA